jgi:hypothetical protein
MGIYHRAVFRAQVPIIKPAQKQKYNNTNSVDKKCYKYKK